MSSNNVNRSKDVFKSRIPVAVSKSKNIDNLQEKKIPISTESSLPKCVNILQKVPGQLKNQPKKIVSSHNRTVKLSNLDYSDKISVDQSLRSGSLLATSEQNRILKQVNSKIKSDVCNKKINSNLEIKSELHKKENALKIRINAKENKNTLHKNSDPSKNIDTTLKESKKWIPKVTRKKIGSTTGKITEPQKNDIVQKSSSEANEKEKTAPKPNYFSSQKDIKFEANDFYRNMILQNRELSPSCLKLQPGLKLSSLYAERPSIYQQEFEIPANPFQEALKSIERMSSAKKDKKPFLIKQSTLPASPFKVERPSIYQKFEKVNPFEEALKSIERMPSVKKDRKPSLIHQNNLPASPFKEHYPLYIPHRDPRNEVMKSLEAIEAKRILKKNLKSSKKVSFNLNVEEYTPRASLDYRQTPFKNSEFRLGKINEKSEENTPTSPQNNINITSSVKHKNDVLTTELVASVKELCTSSQPKEISENEVFNTPRTKSVEISNHTQSSAIAAKKCKNLPKEISSNTMFQSLREIHLKCFSPTSNCDNSRVLCATPFTDIRRMSFQNSVNVLDLKSSEARLYTPRPISISKSTVMNVLSPEFLTNGAKGKSMSNFAPIHTPLVLKNLAECLLSPEGDLSPVRLRLNFTEEDKESPKKEVLTKNLNSLAFEKIVTTQKLLDELADQECCLWLLNENIPVVCGRYLQNPVALTLSEGDEMHFIPI